MSVKNDLPIQLSLFEAAEPQTSTVERLGRANLGTFKDSLRAPVHSWFTYPAGFSYKAVEEAIHLYKIQPGMRIYDPFAGTGTTNLVAQQNSVNSYGVEAHPFVHFVAQTKLFWDYDLRLLKDQIDALVLEIRDQLIKTDLSVIPIEDIFPELVRKCYSPDKLAALSIARDAILQLPAAPFRNFAKLGLTFLLRSVADVATGWPYIAPQKAKKQKPVTTFLIADLLRDRLYQMREDVKAAVASVVHPSETIIAFGDSRQTQPDLLPASAQLAFTSPPYLNNYDYADRTRLEMYFWGEAATWGDITREVRTKLMMSATTQINRSDYDESRLLRIDLADMVPKVAQELSAKVAALSKLRLTKGGKKSYDIMVGGYFNDMFSVLKEAYRVLDQKTAFVLILGDSAPYGVHIPTQQYLADIGLALGFNRYEIEQLRARGEKWKDNPQRHKVPLQECILTLYKD